MGGLGHGNSPLSPTVASVASVYDSKDELSSLAQAGLARPQSLKELCRRFSPLQELIEHSCPSPAPGSPHITSWLGLTSTLIGKSLQSSVMSELRQLSVS